MSLRVGDFKQQKKNCEENVESEIMNCEKSGCDGECRTSLGWAVKSVVRRIFSFISICLLDWGKFDYIPAGSDVAQWTPFSLVITDHATSICEKSESFPAPISM